ncbi:YcjF family protein [Roseibium marinum]|uniref:Uncharacterized protein (DUF697 family) n=1 Tax=Roseibium marinum TaxID=281252 RepID=A0A2S3UJY1_9HYPH|nr:YcjF family protein [Roseibium marinum]POF27890.1 uncharacterized protein (DUF697 family) [Roseibium marinum]
MTRKLPRTSSRTMNDLRRAANSTFAEEEQARRPDAADTDGIVPPKQGQGQSGGDAQETDAGSHAAKEDAGPKRSFPFSNLESLPVRSSPPGKAEFLKNAGQLIVDRHAQFGAIAGLVPLPWVDLAAIAAVVERMLRKLARLYGQPISADRSKHLAAALLTGMAAPGIASFTTSGLLRMTTGPTLLGMAITSVSAAVLIRIVGEVYLNRLSLGPELAA